MVLRLLCCVVMCVALGCKTTKPTDDGNNPIVSPTNISDDKEDEDAPSFPYFIPWWAKKN